MTKKIILGLTGKIACGKGTASAYLIKRYHVAKYGFSDSLREVLNLYDLPITRANMQNLSTLLRQNFSEDILAKAMVKKTKEADNSVVVIDGVRRYTDIEHFFKFKNFFLIFIDTDEQLRFKRYVKRNESPGDSQMEFNEFNKRDTAESETQIEALKGKAHFVITNNGNTDEFYLKIEEAISKIHENKD